MLGEKANIRDYKNKTIIIWNKAKQQLGADEEDLSRSSVSSQIKIKFLLDTDLEIDHREVVNSENFNTFPSHQGNIKSGLSLIVYYSLFHAHSAGAVKYAHCITAEWLNLLITSVQDMTQNNPLARLQF